MDKNVIKGRAEWLAERWRRSLACHGEEIARAEIDFDLTILQRAIAHKENYYNLSFEEAKSLYPIVLKMKEQVFNHTKRAKKKLVSFRFGEETLLKLDHLADKGGTNRTVVLEMLVRKAERFEIEVPNEPENK